MFFHSLCIYVVVQKFLDVFVKYVVNSTYHISSYVLLRYIVSSQYMHYWYLFVSTITYLVVKFNAVLYSH